MANRFNFEGFGILGLIGGIAAVGYSIWKTNKISNQMNDTTKKLDMSIEDVERKTTIDIEQSIIDAAIAKSQGGLRFFRKKNEKKRMDPEGYITLLEKDFNIK